MLENYDYGKQNLINLVEVFREEFLKKAKARFRVRNSSKEKPIMYMFISKGRVSDTSHNIIVLAYGILSLLFSVLFVFKRGTSPLD